MGKDKSAEDTISEAEYTIRMKSASTRPENDSPGDSESDAGDEFEMGLEYLPDEKNDPQMPSNERTLEEMPQSKMSNHKISNRESVEIPNSAKVISSEQPSPWMDQGTSSSTH